MKAPPRHHPLTRLFHWTVAVAVAVMLTAGVLMTSEPLAFAADPLYILHKGLGSVLLFVLLPLRVGWSLLRPSVPLPDTVPERQRAIMRRVHAALYALLAVQVASGYVRTVADRFPIELLDALGMPPLLPSSPRAAGVALVVHQVAAYLLVALVAAHVGAALHDRLIAGRGIWERMAPGRGPRPPAGNGRGPREG